MKKRWISGLAVLALSGAAAMATPSYTAVFLPSPSGANTYAEDIASNGQIVGYSSVTYAQALVWQTPYSSPVNLTPSGYVNAWAFATDGTTQAGEFGISGGAILWNGSAQSYVDLNPPGYTLSQINSIANGQEVGQGLTTVSPLHALLWNGDDPNAIDLNPAGYSTSNANGTNGVYQVGAGTPNPVNGVPQGSRAILWNGTANSAIDITPPGFADAAASKISGNFAVGSGSPGTARQDALLWNIGNGTYTDLEPTNLPGIGETAALAVAGAYEAGYGFFGAAPHALVWSGTADSAIDLQDYLPSTYAYSYAFGVDAQGDVVGYAGAYGQNQAVVWLAPEPTEIAYAILVTLTFAHRRSSRR